MVQTSIVPHLEPYSRVPAFSPAALQPALRAAATALLLKHVRRRPSAAHNPLRVAASFRTESKSSWRCLPSASQAPSPAVPHSILSASWPRCLFLSLGGTPSIEMPCPRCLQDPALFFSGVFLRELLRHLRGNTFPTISYLHSLTFL